MRYRKSYDVVVCGAGIAGVAAALQASRKKLKVALLEKTVFPGGLATAGMVNIFLPLCDGHGRQVIFGIAEELLKLCVEYSPFKLPPGWGGVAGERKSRYRAPFSPASYVLALDRILVDSGIDIWYDTLVCDVEMKGSGVRGVVVENKSGRGLLDAKCTIDATGDADVAFLAGAELETGLNNLSIWGIEASLKRAGAAIQSGDPELLLDMVRLGADDAGRGHPEGARPYCGIDGRSVSQFVLESRALLRSRYGAEGADCASRFPLALPAMAQFRTTRKIVGIERVRNDQENQDIDNCVGSAPDWRSPGRVWPIPYGALVPAKVKGLLTAGRIISVDDGDAWSVCRVIPVAALTGQIAGVAAAISAAKGISTHDVDAKMIDTSDLSDEMKDCPVCHPK
ncbi:MAG: FAD-dependent oxidoreductase [Victivallales bacterium]|nr:FAD-dependent oxidoreductase [Victivallales bacterium]